jgi:hypothetical protein
LLRSTVEVENAPEDEAEGVSVKGRLGSVANAEDDSTPLFPRVAEPQDSIVSVS